MAIIRSAALCLCLLFGFVGAAHATQTFTVNSTLDQIDVDPTDGICETIAQTCTLRAAIMQADVSRSTSVTIIVPPGLYTLTRPIDGSDSPLGGSLKLTTLSAGPTIAINGTDAATTIIDAAHVDRVFRVDQDRSAAFSHLTVRNGSIEDGTGGGGIYILGSLTLDHVVVSDNAAVLGAGIYNDGSVAITNSSILRNVAAAYGGGVYSSGGLSVTASTIASNSALEGGGVNATGSPVILNSTIAWNSARESGGGVYFFQGLPSNAMNMYNSTVVDNEADSDQSNDGSGGGIYVGINGVFNLYNSVLAGNYHINVAFGDDCDGPVKTHAYNRFGNTSQCQITQVSGAYALLNSLDDLGLLQDNGGPTQTIALLAGSNAINGAAATCLDANSTPITTDQRGFPRNVGNCDIGAYEFGAINPNDKIFKDGFDIGGK
jgi:hypothetical protein